MASRRQRGYLMRLLILLCALKAGSFYTPTCHYQDGESRRMCDMFIQIECMEIVITNSSDNEPVLPQNLTLIENKYINATFLLTCTKRIGSEYYVEIPEYPDQCFQVKLQSTNMSLTEDIILWLDFLPYWNLQPNESVKIYRDYLMECDEYYRGSTYTLQTYTPTELRFEFMTIPGVKEVEATLMGGNCEVTCTGKINKCEIGINTTIITNFKKPVHFTDLHPGHYYCVQISYAKRCLVHTKTEYLKNVTEVVVKTTGNHYVIPVVIVTVIAVGILAMFVLRKLYHRGNSLHQPIPLVASPMDWEIIRQSWKNIPNTKKVLLLYSRDSTALSQVMKAFHQLIQKFSYLEVLDLFEWEETEEASRNLMSWLTKHIMDSDVKLVIVVSEGAMIRQKALLDNVKLEFSKPHFLDPVFTQALQLLHDHKLGNDYSRIFPVRFDGFTRNNVKLSLIVPLRCYILLRDLGKLILDLRSAQDEPDLEEIRSQCPSEVDMLENAIKNAAAFYRDTTHYFSNWYHAVK